jgi:hypothetical protein
MPGGFKCPSGVALDQCGAGPGPNGQKEQRERSGDAATRVISGGGSPGG